MFNSKKSETPASIIFDEKLSKADAQKQINKLLTKFIVTKVVTIAAVAVAVHLIEKKFASEDSSEN